MILGTGIDLVDIRRIEKALKAKRFEEKIFTQAERNYANSRPNARAIASAYAKRFAAKEACLKALGTGHQLGVYLGDIEVVKNKHGAPSLTLTGGAQKRLHTFGKNATIHLALTDEYPYAQAMVVIDIK